MKRSWFVSLFFAAYLITVGDAFAITYSFSGITADNPANIATGESQLFLDVTQVNSQVEFLFSNTGPNSSSIADIYFDDPTPLLLFQSLQASPGVQFSMGASPSDLPGGNAFNFTATHSYDSDAPTQPNGINPGEWLAILFNIANTYDFDDVIAQLNDGTLLVGIHVQGFEDGGSESFINNPNNPIPEPGTVLLLGIGLLGISIYGKRRKNFC